jgi:hypothetical protein
MTTLVKKWEIERIMSLFCLEMGVLVIFHLVFLGFCERSFKIVGNEFEMDGKPFRYIAGCFHYFRVHPNSWEQTIRKMAVGGLNAVQTYVAWNLHSNGIRSYNWEGIRDLPRYLSLCEKYNMYVVLRPGPFICGEWEFGGFPAWLRLFVQPNEFRSSAPSYLAEVDLWLEVLLGKVKPFLYRFGGPVITVQIENEYSLYGLCDHAYIRHLAAKTHEILGSETVIFTTDPRNWECGNVDPKIALATIDFSVKEDPARKFRILREWNHGGPLVCSEFYPGWLDHWNEPHHKVSSEVFATALDKVLSFNASVSIYMYIGGTNWGWWAGASGNSRNLAGVTTSYDYDGPLSEAGDMTYKWSAVRDVIKKYRPDIPTYEVANSTKKSYGTVKFDECADLFETLETISDNKSTNTNPLTLEALGTFYGYGLYRSHLPKGGNLSLGYVHDRAYVIQNGEIVGIRWLGGPLSSIPVKSGNIDVLVENAGRENFGNDIYHEKGLTEPVTLDGVKVEEWDSIGITLDKIGQVLWKKVLSAKGPSFFRGSFTIDEVADTFLNPKGWGKGVAFVNGVHIGRYWTVRPQLTLYVPRDHLKQGKNELIILEQEKVSESVSITFDDTPQIDVKGSI